MTTAADTATESDHDTQHDQPRDPAWKHPQAPRRVPAALLAAVAGDAPQWQDRALCAQTDPEAFFPEKGGSTWEAKQICTSCEVRAECLEDALGQDERFGIWGGLSERERRRLKRSGDLPVAEPRAVPEPRAELEPARRESAPAPGDGRHAGGTGLATTLPTEERRPRGRPMRPRPSTFPDRARRADTEPISAATAPSASRTGSPRRTRVSRSVPKSRPGTTAVTTAPPIATPAADDTATIAGRGVGQPDLDPADDQAAAAPKAPVRPPDLACTSTPPADGVLERVLAAHADHPGADTVSAPVVAALATGEPVVEASRWETALAAVVAVESGQTRGAVARQLGEDSRDVAHWVRRHREGMPMIDPRCDGTPEGTTRRVRGGAR